MQISLDRIAAHIDAKERGIFPAQPQANPRGTQVTNIASSSNQGNIQQAKAIITLRSGKAIENNITHPPQKSDEDNVEGEQEEKNDEEVYE